MLRPAEFRELVSGRRRGAAAGVWRSILRAGEVPYRLAVDWRNGRFDRGQAEVVRVGVPVISVGNLTLGGTGKTPLVKWLAQWLAAKGVRPAIVSRGYGVAAGRPNDELLELRQALPDVPHVQNRDRPAAARAAISAHRCNLILLDDGFQHRRLARDLDIVLLDALEPFGFDHVFPRGTLREPVASLRRADVICLSRADAVTPAERASIRSRAQEIAPRAAWCEVVHAPARLTNSSGATQSLESLLQQRVLAFCGIGNPAGFLHTLGSTGCEVVAWREFPDHHAYGPRDVAALDAVAAESRAKLLVCTQKDLVKINQEQIGGRALWAVAIDIAFITGREAMEDALMSVCSISHRSETRG
jgi:tetraacyldisaccharide 4'-kinase